MDLLEGLSQRQETACPVGCPEAENSIIPPPCLGFPSSTQSTCTKRLRFKSFLALACPSCVAVVSVSFAPLTLAGRPPVCVPFSRLAWALLQGRLSPSSPAVSSVPSAPFLHGRRSRNVEGKHKSNSRLPRGHRAKEDRWK